MKRISIFILTRCAVGCATPKSEFDGTNDFSKPIASGLYFLREGAAGRIFESSSEVKSNWQIKARTLCNGASFEALVYKDSDHQYMVTSPEFFLFPLWASTSKAVAEGVVHCSNSTLTKDQAIQVLIDEYYIIRKKP